MRKGDPPVIVEQTFNASVATVWSAITDIDQMRLWYFDNIPSFRPEVGFETRFTVRSDGRDFPHLWKITAVVPQQKIEYNWKYDGYPGDSYVAFELFEQDGLTKLRLTARIVETFSDDVPEFTRESCIGGWEFFIKKSLKDYLAQRHLHNT